MYLLYTDETNYNEKNSEFFIYAGIAVKGELAGELSREIEELRIRYGYKPEDDLKFSTAKTDRPSHISEDDHREIKREVIERARKYDAKLFSSFILHDIAESDDIARRKEINRICYHYDLFLKENRDHGLVLIDPFSDTQFRSILREKFSIGLRGLPYCDVYRLKNIIGFHQACIGTSHFCSLIDIALGSIRYAVNSYHNQNAFTTVSTLMAQTNPLFIRNQAGRVREISIFFSPKRIKVSSYLKKYLELYEFLHTNGIDCEQIPTDKISY